MRRRINIFESIDWITVSIYLALVLIGWVNIYAAVYNPEMKSIFDFDYRSGKQFIWIIFAFVLAIVVLIVEYRFYSFFAYFLYGLFILLLICVLFFGKEINGARSWFVFGNVSLQPSEFVKVTTALAIARLNSSHFFKMKSFKWMVVCLGIIFLPLLLILAQPDVGTAVVFLSFIFVLYREGFSGVAVFVGFYLIVLFIFSLVFSQVTVLLFSLGISLALYYYLEKNLKFSLQAFFVFVGLINITLLINRYLFDSQYSVYMVLVVTIAVVTIFYLWLAMNRKLSNIFIIAIFLFSSIGITYSVDKVFNNLNERHKKRINIVLGLEEDPLGVGYNVNQSKIAIGSGGFSGKGFLKGTQTKFKFVPEQTTDFIFCTVGEEWGFLGSFFIISIFTFLLLRLIYLAERQRSVFSRMFGYAVFSVFFLHFVINLGMTIGLMPVIGIPLPFFSYGGSSLWAFTIFLFIFLRLDASRSALYR